MRGLKNNFHFDATGRVWCCSRPPENNQLKLCFRPSGAICYASSPARSCLRAPRVPPGFKPLPDDLPQSTKKINLLFRPSGVVYCGSSLQTSSATSCSKAPRVPPGFRPLATDHAPPSSAHDTTTQSPRPEVFIFQATRLQTSTGFKATRQLGSQPPKNRKIKTPRSLVPTVPSRDIFTFQASRVQSSCSLLRSSSRQSRRIEFRGQPKQGRSSLGCRSYRSRLHWPLRRLVNPTNGVAKEEDDVMVVSAIAPKSSSGITDNPLSFVDGIIKSDPPLFRIFMMEEARMETDKSQVLAKQQPDQITSVMIFHSLCTFRSQVPLLTKPTHYNLMDIGLLKGHVLVIRHMDSVVCINLVDSKPRSPVDL